MTHPTFTDMRDFALATAQRFASIPDDTPIVESLIVAVHEQEVVIPHG